MPSLHPPPLQNHPTRPAPQPRQESMPPLPDPMARIERIPGPIAHLRVRERRVKGDFWNEVGDGRRRRSSSGEFRTIYLWATRWMLRAKRAGERNRGGS